jgi:hypothetical protein
MNLVMDLRVAPEFFFDMSFPIIELHDEAYPTGVKIDWYISHRCGTKLLSAFIEGT